MLIDKLIDIPILNILIRDLEMKRNKFISQVPMVSRIEAGKREMLHVGK